MWELTPRSKNEPVQKQPRDAAFWAKRVEKLEVPDVAEGAANLNVHGRRAVGALRGFGKMWQKTYRVTLTIVKAMPAEVVQVWKERFPEFNAPQSGFHPSFAGVPPGEVLLINASLQGMPVYTGVRVIYADDESFTVMTPEGHPESAWNTFSAYKEEDGRTIAQVQSLARANDPIYEVGFRVVVGSKAQVRIWTRVLESLAAHFGVTEPVSLEKLRVDPKVQWRKPRTSGTTREQDLCSTQWWPQCAGRVPFSGAGTKDNSPMGEAVGPRP